MHHEGYAYGSWGLVVTMVVLSLFFITRFLPLRTKFEKRSGGAFIAFLVALFAEMYGFPLTIYLLAHFFGVEIGFDHVSGHLLGDLITWLGLGNGWFIVMALSNALLLLGIWMVSSGWQLVYESEGKLVTHGIYKYMRHPQYSGMFVIAMYVRLARKEEEDVSKEFPGEYAEYMKRTPMFFPRWSRASGDEPPSAPAGEQPSVGRSGEGDG